MPMTLVSAPDVALISDPSSTALLGDHGDRQVPPGTVDLAVSVWPQTPPWLRNELAAIDLVAYPDDTAATVAAAARHGLAADQCVLTNGAAEAFWAIAHGLRPRHAVCVHPSFTAPEAALHAADVPVTRLVRAAADDFVLNPDDVPEDADMVVIGRPDNPTGRVEEMESVARLARPGSVVVVDDAFAEFLPDASGVAGHAHYAGLPGVLCVRSLTKVWGLAGLRVGYVTGPAELIGRVRAALQPWPVNSLAAHAVQRLCAPEREAQRLERVEHMASARQYLLTALATAWRDAGLTDDDHRLRIWASPANYVLLGSDVPGLRHRLLEHGLAVRRCETFPGLDDTFVRLAVPLNAEVTNRFVGALTQVIEQNAR